MENFTPVKEAYHHGEDLIRDREDAPGCKDVKKQISLLRERQESVLERVRARRDRLLGAADRPISDFKGEVRDISAWIQESWNVMTALLRGEGTIAGKKRKIEVCIMYKRFNSQQRYEQFGSNSANGRQVYTSDSDFFVCPVTAKHKKQ